MSAFFLFFLMDSELEHLLEVPPGGFAFAPESDEGESDEGESDDDDGGDDGDDDEGFLRVPEEVEDLGVTEQEDLCSLSDLDDTEIIAEEDFDFQS